MNLILEDSNQVKGHTNLAAVFLPFRDEVKQYNWLISDYEVCPSALFNSDIVWLTGEEILYLVENNNIQFIWGIISAFHKNFKLDLDNISIIPVAEEHKTLWSNNPSIQHPESCIEIICWDSTSTIILSNEDTIISKYRNYYTDAKDLNRQNMNVNRQLDFVKSVIKEYISKSKIVEKDIIHVSHGHGYNLDSNFDLVIGNIRYALYKKDFGIIPSIKDEDKIIDIFIKLIKSK